jgi:hypothetical protein
MILAFPQTKERERLPVEIYDDTLRIIEARLDLEQVDQCRGPTNRLGFAGIGKSFHPMEGRRLRSSFG